VALPDAGDKIEEVKEECEREQEKEDSQYSRLETAKSKHF
jgi:hypothetical protein